MIWRFLYWDSVYWYFIPIVLFNWKLNEESLKKVSFENWKLGNTGKAIERNTLYSTCKMRWISKKLSNTFSTASYKVFAWWKMNVIYLFFYDFLAQYFMENVFFLPCCMTCYNFGKSVKAKGRSRNCAISKMNLFVTMV